MLLTARRERGRSTIAKKAAKELSCVYVDTGAMYRAMALYLLRCKVDRENPALIGEACQGAEISIEYKNGEQIVLLNGENVNAFLRTEEVGNMASVSSANPKVREKLLDLQRKLGRVYECCYGWKGYRHYDSSECGCEDLSYCKLSYQSETSLSRTSGKG